MRDLASSLLSPNVVSGLTGLTPDTLRRWEAYGIPLGSGAAPRGTTAMQMRRRPTPRLYSWRDVEQLQRASYLVKYRRVSLAGVARLLAQEAAAEPDRDWVLARPRPGRGRQAEPRPRSRRGGVVAVRIRSTARRRSRRERPAPDAARRSEDTRR